MNLLPLHDEPPEEARAELEERAAALRERPASEAEAEVLWLAGFPLGPEHYAIPLAQMRAALPLQGVTPLPLAPPHTLGLLRFQDQVVSVHSLAALLGVRGWTRDPAVLLVVEDGADGLLAIDCERIPEPLAVPRPEVEQARTQGREVLVPGRAPLRLLDVPALLATEAARVR
jgi:purine-binding chemotaxis protein CheW